MKKIHNNKWKGGRYLCLLAVLLACASCEKSMMGYEGTEAIYFSMQKDGKSSENVYLPNISINLMNYVGDEVELALNIKITGDTKDYDRPYRVGIVADSTTAVAGIDYILPEGGVIKAGQYSDSLYVKLIKNDKLQETSVRLLVQVLPNEYFSTDFSQFAHDGRSYNVFDPRVYDITYTAQMTEPYYWTSVNEDNIVENGNLGYFTVKKITLINELYSLTYADWQEESTSMSSTRVKVIYKKFALYLIQQYKNRTPVLEDDGRLMWVTGCPWTSVVGEPWDGTYIEIDD